MADLSETPNVFCFSSFPCVKNSRVIRAIRVFPIRVPDLEPSTSDLLSAARAAFIFLDRFDDESRRKHPSLLTVFRLYCMQNLTVYQIARQCRCSVGTVSQRLKLIHRKTGRPPKAFRALWPPSNLNI